MHCHASGQCHGLVLADSLPIHHDCEHEAVQTIEQGVMGMKAALLCLARALLGMDSEFTVVAQRWLTVPTSCNNTAMLLSITSVVFVPPETWSDLDAVVWCQVCLHCFPLHLCCIDSATTPGWGLSMSLISQV